MACKESYVQPDLLVDDGLPLPESTSGPGTLAACRVKYDISARTLI